MKTIRQSIFESNSSSTHAFSVNIINPNNKPDCTFIPDENNEIHIKLENGPGASNATPQDKSSLLLLYAGKTGNQDLFNRVITIIEDFTKAKVVTSYSSYDYSSKSHVTISPYIVVVTNKEDNFNNDVGDTFYDFCSDLGHGSEQEFNSVMNEVIKSDESIRTFIFSSKQGFCVAAGYEG